MVDHVLERDAQSAQVSSVNWRLADLFDACESNVRRSLPRHFILSERDRRDLRRVDDPARSRAQVVTP